MLFWVVHVQHLVMLVQHLVVPGSSSTGISLYIAACKRGPKDPVALHRAGIIAHPAASDAPMFSHINSASRYC